MKKKLAPVTFDTVRELGLALPDVKEGTAYGSPALKVDGDLLACIAVNKSAEPDSLAVRIDFDQRDELLAADPRVYYVTHHYIDYPCVLVRLPRIHRDALGGLLQSAHRFVTTRKRGRKPRARPGGTLSLSKNRRPKNDS